MKNKTIQTVNKSTHTKTLARLFAGAFLLSTAQISMGSVIIALESGEFSSSRIRGTSTGSLSQTDQANRVGTLSFGGNDTHVTFAFQMTEAFVIETADFSATWTANGVINENIDVFASRVSAVSTILVSDFDASNLIQADFVTTADSAGLASLNASGQTALRSYLSANWVEDSYVFITLANSNPLNNSSNVGRTFGGSASSDAKLTLTQAAPEPSSLALLGMGAALLAASRKRKLLRK